MGACCTVHVKPTSEGPIIEGRRGDVRVWSVSRSPVTGRPVLGLLLLTGRWWAVVIDDVVRVDRAEGFVRIHFRWEGDARAHDAALIPVEMRAALRAAGRPDLLSHG